MKTKMTDIEVMELVFAFLQNRRPGSRQFLECLRWGWHTWNAAVYPGNDQPTIDALYAFADEEPSEQRRIFEDWKTWKSQVAELMG